MSLENLIAISFLEEGMGSGDLPESLEVWPETSRANQLPVCVFLLQLQVVTEQRGCGGSLYASTWAPSLVKHPSVFAVKVCFGWD